VITLKVTYSPYFFNSLDKLSLELRKRFIKKIEKIKQVDISRKHLKYGLPYFVEKITNSSRLIYKIEKDILIFVICFKNHKGYEKWYKSLK